MAATNANAGWGRDSWLPKSSSAGCRVTSRFQYLSENWKLLLRISPRLSNEERRRRVGYTGGATFNGVPGDPCDSAAHLFMDVERGSSSKMLSSRGHELHQAHRAL